MRLIQISMLELKSAQRKDQVSQFITSLQCHFIN
jgi:hypothetical protein